MRSAFDTALEIMNQVRNRRPTRLLDLSNSNSESADISIRSADSEGARLLMEDDTEYLVRTLKSVEASYRTDILTLTVACGYLDRWFAQPKVLRYLERFHNGVLGSLRELMNEVRRPNADFIHSKRRTCFRNELPVSRRGHPQSPDPQRFSQPVIITVFDLATSILDSSPVRLPL